MTDAGDAPRRPERIPDAWTTEHVHDPRDAADTYDLLANADTVISRALVIAANEVVVLTAERDALRERVHDLEGMLRERR